MQPSPYIENHFAARPMGCRAILRAATLLLFASIPASAVDIAGLTVAEPPSGSLDVEAEAQTTICTFIVEGTYARSVDGCTLWRAHSALRGAGPIGLSA